VAGDLVGTLATFHRDMLLPDIKRVAEESEHRVRDQMHGIFDSLAPRLDRLETETGGLVAPLGFAPPIRQPYRPSGAWVQGHGAL
jgi:hypothetical protein